VSFSVQKKSLLLHCCCAPCAAPSIERVLADEFKVTLYFANSNISPASEYETRLKEVRRLATIMDVLIEEDQYDHAAWLEAIAGLEEEPEKGARCERCFEFSLTRTHLLAKRGGYDHFATTLTLSPHKVSRVIFEVGSRFPRFLPLDFKKRDGFRRSLKLSEQFNLYRQNYCGCEFSFRTPTQPDQFT
jgi:predicted adenine nucleotide alpha hydrolase (AANH) superfamily ATPase